MLCLDAPHGLIRGFIHSHEAYIVPRLGQGYIVGATMVNAGFDRTEDPAAIQRLAEGARLCIPALARASVKESWTGLRPRLAGGTPLIDRVGPGLLIATGHFRNGILLAPLTAEIISDVLMGRRPPSPCRREQHLSNAA